MDDVCIIKLSFDKFDKRSNHFNQSYLAWFIIPALEQGYKEHWGLEQNNGPDVSRCLTCQ